MATEPRDLAARSEQASPSLNSVCCCDPASLMPNINMEEEKPFLAEDIDGSTRVPRRTKRLFDGRRTVVFLAVANALLLIVCITLSLMILRHSFSSTKIDGPTEPYSPAKPFIEYEYRTVEKNATHFLGTPGAEWEESMHKLLEGTLLRISQDELDHYNTDSIPLKDGGYAAGLGVAHNLHCVKKIKQFIYREHFYPDLHPQNDDFEMIRVHADHCLDWIRQVVMCNADYSLYTLFWAGGHEKPIHRGPDVQKCVNWEKLHQWMMERSTSSDMLIRP